MKPKILVVYEDFQMRSLFREFLGEHFEIETVSNQAEALRSIQNTKPQMMIIDVQSPKEDGLQFYQTIKKDTELGSIRLLLLVSEGASAAHAGLQTDEFLLKPFGVQALIQRLHGMLKIN